MRNVHYKAMKGFHKGADVPARITRNCLGFHMGSEGKIE